MQTASIIAAVSLLASGCGQGRTAASGTEGTEPVKAENGTEETDIQTQDPESSTDANESSESDSQSGQVASADETISPVDVVTEDMTPIYGTEIKDGVYPITVDSSSSMFHITDGKLTVSSGIMEARITMSGTGYGKLYLGTGEEAVKAAETDYILSEEDETGACTFLLPVEALDAGISCSAYSKKKEKWYDRTLVFRADSLPADAFSGETFVTAEDLGLEDGRYTAEVALDGGSGRASVESPASLRVEDGTVYATIVWGSANYDYMKVNDEKYQWAGTEEHSTFEIPVAGFDWKMTVIADTTAMSVPHEVTYTLTFDSASLQKVE